MSSLDYLTDGQLNFQQVSRWGHKIGVLESRSFDSTSAVTFRTIDLLTLGLIIRNAGSSNVSDVLPSATDLIANIGSNYRLKNSILLLFANVGTGTVTLTPGSGMSFATPAFVYPGTMVRLLMLITAENTLVCYTDTVSSKLLFPDAIQTDSVTAKTTNGDLLLLGNGTGFVKVRGGLRYETNFANSTNRPAITGNAIIRTGTIRAIGLGGTNSVALSNDDGFIRLQAGGGTNSNSFCAIDISGYSNVTDMDRNIVMYVSGVERLRIANTGVATFSSIPLIPTTTPTTSTQVTSKSYVDSLCSNGTNATTASSTIWGATTPAVTVRYAKNTLTNIVTVSWSASTETATVAGTTITITAGVASGFRPLTDAVFAYAALMDNTATENGNVALDINGTLTFTGAFSGAGQSGFYAGSVSFYLV